MKKFLTLSALVASIAFFAPQTEAKTASASVTAGEPIVQTWRNNQIRRNRRGAYVTNRTRLVRVGRRVYRETYRVRVQPNGRTQIRLISRVRIR